MFLLVIFLLLAGLGRELFLIKILGVVLSGLLLIIIRKLNGRIRIPKNFKYYFLFLIILDLNLFWSRNLLKSLEQFSLFVAGGGFWLVSYNDIQGKFKKWLDKLIVVLGLIFAGLWSWNIFYLNNLKIKPFSLFEYHSSYKNHLILGDWWALVLIVVFIWLMKNYKSYKSIVNWLLVFIGSCFIFISQSRSALMSVLVGLMYLFKRKNNSERINRKIPFILLIMFIVFSFSKSSLLVRDFYFQSLVGLKNYPFGVGLGNFGIISKDTANHVFGRSDFSFNAHNIVFEMVSGVGVLSLLFIYWLVKVVKDAWEDKRRQGLVHRAVFLGLTVNFLLFSSYYQPALLWLWFILLGVSQK